MSATTLQSVNVVLAIDNAERRTHRPCLEAASIAFRLEARIDRDADIFRVCHYGMQVQKGIEVWLGGFESKCECKSTAGQVERLYMLVSM